MEDAVDDDPLWLHLVHQTVGSNDQLAKAGVGRVREGTSATAELRQRIASVADSLGNRGCERGGVPGNILNCLDQIVGGRFGPDYPVSHFESRLLTSS
jgi:hypothetical protein